MTDAPARRPRSRDPALGGAIARRARSKREATFLSEFPELGSMDVLDLGGTSTWWRDASVRPATVTVLNLRPGRRQEEWIIPVRGDACDPPRRVRRRAYDLVFSNSLIEHVGGDERRRALAGVVADLAPRHWVQTPNRWFPIEPHWVFPGLQFLPEAAQATVVQWWPFGHVPPPRGDRERALAAVRGVELIGPRELQAYFPDSRLVRERMAGLTKSIIAVR